MDSSDSLMENIINLKQQLKALLWQHYLEQEVWTWVWWVGIASIFISAIVLILVIDRKRLLEICVYGLLVTVMAIFLDVFGSEYVLWEYRIRTLPVVPLLLPVDMVGLPMIFMIIYQKCGKWKSYIIISTIAAALLSFALEPLAVFVGQYKLLTWKYIYSFPIYILIAVVCKFATQKAMELQRRAH